MFVSLDFLGPTLRVGMHMRTCTYGDFFPSSTPVCIPTRSVTGIKLRERGANGVLMECMGTIIEGLLRSKFFFFF
jgi:hypothetical protein